MEQDCLNLISQETKDKIDNFIKYHYEKKNNIVLITSGGTTVPLEQNTVRFIDNFSIGTRGSASAEYFLEKSYAVLFLYRMRSLKPFERRLNNINILDIIKPNSDPSLNKNSYEINESLIKFDFDNLIKRYNEIKSNNLLLNIEFTTLFDYFSILEYSCKKLNYLGTNAMIYLAAAVSDFYIPKNEMPKHKIQSNSGGLVLDLKQVPKLVGKLKSEWCPQAFLITFKLETDPNLLFTKCNQSLEKYKHEVVIGNILEQRKTSVIIMQANKNSTEINLNTKNQEIEELIVNFLVNLHSNFKTDNFNNNK